MFESLFKRSTSRPTVRRNPRQKTRRLSCQQLENRELMAADGMSAAVASAPVAAPYAEHAALVHTALAPRAAVQTAVSTNDTLATAENMGNVDGATRIINGSVGGSDPRDYYKFTITRTQTVSVQLTGLSGDIDLQLLDSSGTVLASSTRGGSSFEVVATVLNSGTYYVKTAPFGSAASSYRLEVSAGAIANNLRSSADNFGTVQATTLSKTGNVGGTDPVDFWKFTPLANGFPLTGRIAVSVRLTGMSQDLDLYVYDANGNLVNSSRNGGTANETLNLTLSHGGLYYVKVAPYGNAQQVASNYTLTIGVAR